MFSKNDKSLQNIRPFSVYDWMTFFLIAAFFCVNVVTLMAFPTVHSDELWLKGIAIEILDQGRFDVTEPFYDLYPRVIHPFRWLYNSLLIIALKTYGPSVVAVRLVALIFGTLCLPLVYEIARKHFESPLYGLAATFMMCLDIQFIYSSHLGRQETIILFLLLLGYWLILKDDVKYKVPKLSLLILLGMGVHPNSFILGVCFAVLLFYKWLMREARFSHFLKLVLMTAIGALFYAIIGYLMNPNFIEGYLNFGKTLGVDTESISRFEGFYWYWYKLFNQIGGTYDLFDIKLPLILLGLLALIWLPLLLIALTKVTHNLTTRQEASVFYPFVTVIGIALSILVIGRYNQTSIVFMTPFICLLTLQSLHLALSAYGRLFNKKSPILLPALLLVLAMLWGSNLWSNLKTYETNRFYSKSYDAMLNEIAAYVPENSVVLGNLNIIEAFNQNRFYDIRNLGYLDTSTNAFQNYVESRNIQYIILHEEMDYIARTSPKWDFLYVTIDYYDAMQAYLASHTTRIHAFENPLYAMRISSFSGTYPWQTVIYKVDE
ncbi:MAG TPA: hypothetical protein VLS94_06385 [Fusibacter sp.]|nr:hypothetical protein [Fusibacter sp.]